jgi:hypothetical protein
LKSERGRPLKDRDTLFSIPANVPSRVRVGYDNHAFLTFCDNHEKPFGFLKKFSVRLCPRCGNGFIEKAGMSFEMIKTGYTVTQEFINGEEVTRRRNDETSCVPADVLDAEYLDD